MKASLEKPSKKVSERMRKVKSRETGLEKRMESILISLGIKYEKQPNLRGKPDFRISGTNVLIFCDSLFWHGKREKEITGEAFKKNRKFWQRKLLANRRRDQRTNRSLRRSGWSVQVKPLLSTNLKKCRVKKQPHELVGEIKIHNLRRDSILFA